MSSYENYARVSTVYNETRTAQGVEIVRRLLAKGDTALTEQTLVDAGCGTGQYSAALAGSVGRIEAVDLNPAMLAQARHKLQRQVDAGAIGLHQASEVPFWTRPPSWSLASLGGCSNRVAS